MALFGIFGIFGNDSTNQVVKNVTRQPLSNIENMGKMVSTGPIKPNEPMKKAGKPKKSFLANTGKALQSTPARKVFTPRTDNFAPVIYSDDIDNIYTMEELEFTKPTFKFDNYKLSDFLLSESELKRQEVSPPSTPPPKTRQHTFELDNSSHQDDFFTDEFSLSSDSLQDDLGLPALY